MVADGPVGVVSVLEVAIGEDTAGTFRVEVVRSPAGEASVLVGLDVAGLSRQRGQVQQALLASAVSARRVLSASEQVVRQVGQELFTALLGTGEVAGQYRASQAVAAERGQHLRLVVRIDSPQLAGLPWEAMYDEGLGAYVCRGDQLVRHVPVPAMPGSLQVRAPLRVLGVVSSPRGLPALDIDKEREQLEQALACPIRAGLVQVCWAPSATWAGLHEELMDGPWHVVHYIGHGDFDPDLDEGILALERAQDGRIDQVAAHRVVDLLRQADPMPRLVVLNSCSGAAVGTHDLFSGTAASLVRGGVTAVAAMQYEISDPAAVAFARGFYTALARGRGIDQATTSGRVGILGTGAATLEWITPVLYLRGGQTHLYTIPPALTPSLPRTPTPANVDHPDPGRGNELPVERGRCTGRLTSPHAGTTVGTEIRVEGTVHAVPPRHHIWIAHQDQRGLFWAKDFEVVLDDDGHFERVVNEDGSSREFAVLLLLTSPAGHIQLANWMAECSRSDSYPGIPPSPDRFHILDRVEVHFDPSVA